MKKASNVRLSFRKLLIATLAVGPLAVLPAPVWAAVPVAQQFSVTSGTASWSTAGVNSGTVQASDKSVLVWNAGQFNIAAGDTFNFTLPAGGAVLNKVGYTTTGALGAVDNVTINGTLFSTGRVFVLANGAITIGNTASITTNGGLYLSTLVETSDFSFATAGTLSGTGASTGTITIGAAGALPSFSGNLNVDAGSIVSHGATVTGDVIMRSVTAASAVDLSQSGAFSAGGNLSVTTNAGAINGTMAVTAGLQVSGNQTAAFSTGAGGAVGVTLANAANNFEVVTVNAPGATANVALTDVDNIILGASTIGQNLSVIAQPVGAVSPDGNAISTSGTVVIGKDAFFQTSTARANVTIANSSTIGGTLTGTLLGSTLNFNGAGNVMVGAVNAGTGRYSGITVTGANGTVTANGALTAVGNNTDGAGITLTGGTVTTTGAISQTLASGSAVTFNATSGGVSIGGTVTGARVVGTTAGGAINQTAVITTSNTTAVSAFTAGTGTITLTQANAFAAGQTLRLTGAAASVTNTNNIWLGNTTITGGLNLVAQGAATIQLGAGLGTAGERIGVGGVLTATTAGGVITDQDYGSQNYEGGINLTTAGGAVTLDSAWANGALSPQVRYGAVTINSGAGAISIAETTTLNFASVTTTGGLTARSVTGGIVDSGTINTGGSGATFLINSGTESVVLDNAGHTIGTLTVNGGSAANAVLVGATGTTLGSSTNTPGLTLASGSAGGITLGVAGATATVTNLTVNSSGMINVNGPVAATNLWLSADDATATSIVDSATGRLVVSGNTTLASKGNITLDTAGHDFSSLIFNGVTGNARVDDATAVTVSGMASQLMDVRAGANAGGIAAAWNVSLGNITTGSLNIQAQDGGGGNSGTITQLAGTTLRSEAGAAFTADNANIVIGNSGNSFGRVSAVAGNGGITLREYGTVRLGTFTNNGTASSITSETGSIIEDNTPTFGTTYTTTNGTLTLMASATDGSIQLGRVTNVVGGPVTAGASTSIVASAPNGSVQLLSTTANLTLGNITGNSFSVVHTGTGNLLQSGWIRSYGAASFTGAGNITMSNTTNNFGRVSIISNGAATKNVTITEAGTLNLGTVTVPAAVSGNFTATSVNSDIIDSGLGGVKLGGTIAAPGTGVVTLAAAAGNIVLDDPTTDFASNNGIVFNGGNVTLAGLGQTTIWLGAAGQPSTAGNLTVTSAIGSIGNTGNLTVSGAAFFQAGAGNITINQPANQFGSLRFVGNQVAIAQTNNMNLLTGTSAIGQAQLASTGGNMTITNVGGGAVSFGNTVSISASGSITLPKLLQAVGTLSVTAAGTKDLSALSKTADLSGKDPSNLGTGTYVPPSP